MSNRVALLITNIKFTDEKFNRNGAEKDEENTEKLLTALGYEVVKHTNLTGKVPSQKGTLNSWFCVGLASCYSH